MNFKGFLTRDYQLIAQDVKLKDMFVHGAELRGKWINGDNAIGIAAKAVVDRHMFSETKRAFQLVARDPEYIKCVHITLEQRGTDVLARADWADFISANRGDIHHDFSDASINAEKREAKHRDLHVEPDSNGYGVFNLEFKVKHYTTSRENGLCPRKGRYVVLDGTNLAGWSRRRGEPRLVQTLAVCLWFAKNGVKYTCWFDANFRHTLKRHNPEEAGVLERLLHNHPEAFKQAPAGKDESGNPIRADVFVIRDASVCDGLVLSDDRFVREVKKHPDLYGWVNVPGHRIPGQIAGNGDVLLGDGADIHIPVPARIDDTCFQ